jgi:hypothetical protein
MTANYLYCDAISIYKSTQSIYTCLPPWNSNPQSLWITFLNIKLKFILDRIYPLLFFL